MTNVAVAILAILGTIGVTSSLFLDSAFQANCPALPPCTCDSASFINCNTKGFTTVPPFRNMTRPYGTMDLSLNMNHIHHLTNNSFLPLDCSMVHGSLLLSFYSNGLRSIDEHAFASIEDCVNYLNFDANQLTYLPKTLLHLPKLRHILVENNPIQTFDASVMQSLGHSLTRLYIGARYLNTWPSELHYLSKLEVLWMFDVDYQDMNVTAFDGFSNSLKELQITGTNLQLLPPSLCNLTKLQTLELNYDHRIQNFTDFLPFCNAPLSAVRTVKFDSCNLHTLWSNIFFLFPNMVTLQVSNNKQLSQIDESIIPENKLITNLDLHGNSLDAIPQAIHKLHSLQRLDVSGNHVMGVENEELQNMAFLRELKLQDNQISYISSDAFKFQSGLRVLNLANNQLSALPRALADITNLQSLDVSRNPISCDCGLAWIKTWSSYPAVKIAGLCSHSSLTIMSYLSSNLAQC